MKRARVGWQSLGLCVLLAVAQVQAQQVDPPAWTESEVQLPQRFSVQDMVSFELDKSTSMTYGIDPRTLSIGSDGVVRYVFIARSGSGALNALYEGIRCQSAEVRVYGRWDVDANTWRTDGSGTWQPLAFRGPTRRAMQMAGAGVCNGKLANGTPRQILNTLRFGRTDQFR